MVVKGYRWSARCSCFVFSRKGNRRTSIHEGRGRLESSCDDKRAAAHNQRAGRARQKPTSVTLLDCLGEADEKRLKRAKRKTQLSHSIQTSCCSAF